MHATNHVPPRRRCLACGLGAAAVLALVAGCAAPLEPGSTPATASQKTTAANPATSQAPRVDTSGWKSFETFGVGFRYPAHWSVVPKMACEGCEPSGDPRQDPYAKWNILDANGIPIAEFGANSAEDNAGDATYVRTRLETIELDSNMATPTVVLFEHSLANTPTRENNRTAALMVDEAALAAERDEFPQLAYFRPRKDAAAMLETTNGFAKSLGFTAQDVSLGDAVEMMDTEGYRDMVALMLSVRAVAQ
ncbi:hypothetical protein ACSYDW_05040 [Paeniglutamicibacter sp. R2-26]|uniref:hypothetical protein n=1 Tax=Paeniglutamicibacter sp. R2-26 TaxID=3144417 RepID=UPI003EE50CB6